jgi:hypothetical protein
MARPMRKFEPEQVVKVEPTDFTYQAYATLFVGFIALPVIAGVDKFFNLLADWTQYLAPVFPTWTGVDAAMFMMFVGVIEIAAGLVVAAKPSWGGYLVAAWLWSIIINLLLIPGFFDIALRDFGLSLGALALARLSHQFGR